jgi:hypothetical protein
MIVAIQIMAIAYFIAAIKLKFWKTSLNTFIVFGAVFFITILSNIDALNAHWVNIHLSIVAFTISFMMGRVVYQRCMDTLKKINDDKCKECMK